MQGVQFENAFSFYDAGKFNLKTTLLHDFDVSTQSYMWTPETIKAGGLEN